MPALKDGAKRTNRIAIEINLMHLKPVKDLNILPLHSHIWSTMLDCLPCLLGAFNLRMTRACRVSNHHHCSKATQVYCHEHYRGFH